MRRVPQRPRVLLGRCRPRESGGYGPSIPAVLARHPQPIDETGVPSTLSGRPPWRQRAFPPASRLACQFYRAGPQPPWGQGVPEGLSARCEAWNTWQRVGARKGRLVRKAARALSCLGGAWHAAPHGRAAGTRNPPAARRRFGESVGPDPLYPPCASIKPHTETFGAMILLRATLLCRDSYYRVTQDFQLDHFIIRRLWDLQLIPALHPLCREWFSDFQVSRR